MGMLLGLDTLVAHAFGAGRLDECHRWLLHGLTLSLIVAPVLTVAGIVGIALLPRCGLQPAVLALTVPYLHVIVWSLLPLLLYASFRRYLQALGIVDAGDRRARDGQSHQRGGRLGAGLRPPRPAGDGDDRLGRRHADVAHLPGARRCSSRSSRPTGATTSACAACRGGRRRKRLVRLVRLGLPAAVQVTLEMGVFAAASALAGRLDPVSLASHQIALNLASLTFMVPLGLASAGAVRVGQAVGRHDARGAERSGWMALTIGTAFMSSAALVFVVAPRPLIGVFSSSEAVFAVGRRLLLIAAMFQLFDGLQGVSTGVLRGLGDTRTPMLTNLAGHWLLGLPVGYALCFWWKWGVVGLWIGLSIGLIAIGSTLLLAWHRRIAALRARP